MNHWDSWLRWRVGVSQGAHVCVCVVLGAAACLACPNVSIEYTAWVSNHTHTHLV